MTVHDAIREYLLDCQARNLSPQTLRWYAEKLRAFRRYVETQQITDISQLNSKVLREFLAQLRTRPSQERAPDVSPSVGLPGNKKGIGAPIVETTIMVFDESNSTDHWPEVEVRLILVRDSRGDRSAEASGGEASSAVCEVISLDKPQEALTH